jgi:signal transduction histidine kinase
MNNIVKHAATTEVSIQLQRLPQSLNLMIRDNGRGFIPAAVEQASDGKGSFGLAGMTERARLLGGMLKIESAPGTGTLIALTIPLLHFDKDLYR